MRTLLFHKPYGVLSQFSPEAGSSWQTLAAYIAVPGVYAAGRLDADSEGLLLLSDSGPLQRQLTDPRFGHWRRYWVQVEGDADAHPDAIAHLSSGVMVQGRRTLPARARVIDAGEVEAAGIGPRQPPIRQRRQIPTSWLQLELREGRNRQVRRMSAAVGLPTLRLIRMGIDLMDGGPPLSWAGLAQGQWRPVDSGEQGRLQSLLLRSARPSVGRGGRPGGGKSGQGGSGG